MFLQGAKYSASRQSRAKKRQSRNSNIEWRSAFLGRTPARTLLVFGLCAMAFMSVQIEAAATENSSIRFENRQKQSGINFILKNGTTDDKPIIDTIVGGVALLDYDNDGYLDIFFTSGARIPDLIKDGPNFSNRLYHNNHGTFTDVTDRAGIGGEGYERAKVSLHMKNYQDARKDAERAAVLPDTQGVILDLQIYALLGQIYARLGNQELSNKYNALSRTAHVPVQERR
jgi:hypothetical protein